jgi:AraC-like DNA-binding protein
MNSFEDQFFQELADYTQLLCALEQLPGALFMIKNLDSRYVYMSRALRDAINLPPGQEVVGRTDFDIFPKIIAESFRQNDLLVFKHGKPLVNEVHATGFFADAPKWTFSSKYPLHDRSAKVLGLITINRPYTEVMGLDAELNRLLPAIEHVFRDYAEPITIGTLAQLCSFSESHFMRVFRQSMKMTAQVFVEQVRMFHAIDAIKHTAYSIARIAQDAGFYDHSSFVKRFKAFTGTTPLRYRHEMQAKLKTERTIALPQILNARCNDPRMAPTE